jgi:solute carrier family 25 carnitine/acylcarnitine transporter 20/29
MSGDPAPTMTHLFVAGGTAGFMYWVLFYPLDVIKSAMMTDALDKPSRKFGGILATTKTLWGEGGVSRFYKGVTPCLLRAVPANAIMLITVVRFGMCLQERAEHVCCRCARALY